MCLELTQTTFFFFNFSVGLTFLVAGDQAGHGFELAEITFDLKLPNRVAGQFMVCKFISCKAKTQGSGVDPPYFEIRIP